MTARMKLSHFFKLAMSLLIIAALHTPLSAADKEYIEVEIDGETVGKWLELASIDEYDSTGNKIHAKNSAGDEEWYEYNSKGEMIHCKKSSGFEYWYEFDNNGRRIYSKDSDGVEEWNAYDQYGNPVRTIVKRNGKLDNVHVHILEYYKNSETLKKDTCYSFSG